MRAGSSRSRIERHPFVVRRACEKPARKQRSETEGRGALALWGQPDYILTGMGRPPAMKTLSAVAVAVLLLGHSPVAAGMLLCIGDGTDPDCCRKPHDSHESRLDESRQHLDRSDCSCCITVDAAPSTVGASSHKASLDIASGSGLIRNVATPTGTRNSQAASADAADTRLSALRTVVLVI